MMFICGKGKDDYLTIATTPPQKEDPMFKTWRLENNMAMFWLINTIDNEVKQNFTFYGRAKDIWDAAKEAYFGNKNTIELSEIKSTLHALWQGDLCFLILQYPHLSLTVVRHV